MRVPGGGEPFARPGSASRPSTEAPTAVAPAPFRNLRRVVLVCSSAIFATASSTAFASGVRAINPPLFDSLSRLTVRHRSLLRNPVGPCKDSEQCDEGQVPGQDGTGTVERVYIVPVATRE